MKNEVLSQVLARSENIFLASFHREKLLFATRSPTHVTIDNLGVNSIF
jgi:hypothetical protein